MLKDIGVSLVQGVSYTVVCDWCRLDVTGSDWHYLGMEETEREELARNIKAARLHLAWSKEKAARAAEVSVITYKRVEDGLPVQDAKLNAIMRALDDASLGVDHRFPVTPELETEYIPAWNTRKPEGMTDEQHKAIVRETQEFYQFKVQQASEER